MSTQIHPTASLGDGVELGEGVHVEAHAVLRGPCRVGDGTWIGPHVALGMPAQMRGGPLDPADGAGVVIGDRCVVREFVSVHQGTERPTEVGADAYLMAYAHVPHDAVLGVGCTLSNSAQLGGHTWIGDGANVGLGATVHQRSTIGAYAMVGMQSAVTRPVPPFTKVIGVPARPLGVNVVALERLGIAVVEPWLEEAILAGGSDDPRVPDVVRTAFEQFARAVDRPGGRGR